MEKWKDIPGLHGYYQASTCGRIRSINRISNLTNQFGKCLRSIKGKIIRQTLHKKTGYYYVSICVESRVSTKLVHRLVASAFIPNHDNKPHINHKKGIKTDNRPSQLEWSTISENRQHSYNIGLQTADGIKNSQAKLDEKSVLKIRNSNIRTGKLALMFGVSPATICDIKTRRSWTHI